MTNQTTFERINKIAIDAGLNDDYQCTYAKILAGCIDMQYSDIDAIDDTELLQALHDCNANYADDFMLDTDGIEYRIIQDTEIWDIYVQAIKDIVMDCYDIKLDNIPDFVAWAIDWEATAHNAYSDGYGRTFNSWDWKEKLTDNGYWIFRVN